MPLTLPGELVSVMPGAARGEGRSALLKAVLEPSPDRIAPPCPHFGECGGCVLQHWADPAYIAWKQGLLASALRRAGVETVGGIAPAARTPPGARRRMDLAVRRDKAGRVTVGLHRLRSGDVVDLATCLVLHPALVALFAPLREMLAGLSAVRRQGSAVANLLDGGPDLLLRLDGVPSLADRTKLLAFARAHRLPRLSVARGDGPPEPVCVLRRPDLALSGVPLAPAPGAFLQASPEGEAALRAAILAALPDTLPPRARIAELFAGIGTFTFALAGRGRVTAFEGDEAAIAALRDGANRGGFAGRIEPVRRDLVRAPLAAAELKPFAAVVLDPPWAGAPAQMRAIAEARPPTVVYVSCNPAALARDAVVLHAAGYAAAAATPVDQFLWSARLESVVAFTRR